MLGDFSCWNEHTNNSKYVNITTDVPMLSTVCSNSNIKPNQAVLEPNVSLGLLLVPNIMWEVYKARIHVVCHC